MEREPSADEIQEIIEQKMRVAEEAFENDEARFCALRIANKEKESLSSS